MANTAFENGRQRAAADIQNRIQNGKWEEAEVQRQHDDKIDALAERKAFEKENVLPGHEAVENKGAVDFKSADAYHKWLAFGHMHGKFHGNEKIEIRGKAHKVKHGNAFSSGQAKAQADIGRRMNTGKWGA